MEKAEANFEQAGKNQQDLLEQVAVDGAVEEQVVEGLLWCRLVGWLLGSRLIWRMVRRCIWMTSRGIIVIVLVRLVSIAIHIIIGILRGWCGRIFHHFRIV